MTLNTHLPQTQVPLTIKCDSLLCLKLVHLPYQEMIDDCFLQWRTDISPCKKAIHDVSVTRCPQHNIMKNSEQMKNEARSLGSSNTWAFSLDLDLDLVGDLVSVQIKRFIYILKQQRVAKFSTSPVWHVQWQAKLIFTLVHLTLSISYSSRVMRTMTGLLFRCATCMVGMVTSSNIKNKWPQGD